MLTYKDGSPIRVGDSVLLEHGQTPGTVELVVVTSAQMEAIGVEESGVMLLSAPFGRVYLPKGHLENDPLQFVSQEKIALLPPG